MKKKEFSYDSKWYKVTIENSVGNVATRKCKTLAEALADTLHSYGPPRMFQVLADAILCECEYHGMPDHQYLGETPCDNFFDAAKAFTTAWETRWPKCSG